MMLKQILTPLLALFSLSALVLGQITPPPTEAVVRGSIVGPPTEDYQRDLDALVLLDDGLFSSHITKDGTFALHHVPIGTYLLTVQSMHHEYPVVKVQVKEGGVVIAYAHLPGTDWTTQNEEIPYPMILRVRGFKQYFLKREGFNFMSLLMSPYALMMIFTAVMIYAVPKMMENMDPEDLKNMQKSQTDAQKLTSFFSPSSST